eukprot:3753708-Amphidinium_carterae.1
MAQAMIVTLQASTIGSTEGVQTETLSMERAVQSRHVMLNEHLQSLPRAIRQATGFRITPMLNNRPKDSAWRKPALP